MAPSLRQRKRKVNYVDKSDSEESSTSNPRTPPRSNSSARPVFPAPPARPKTPTSMRQMKASNDFRLSSMAVDSTPAARGSAALTAYEEGLVHQGAKYYRQNYHAYIREDLENNRVSVPADDFLRVVFDVAFETRQSKEWQGLIGDIETDAAFAEAWSSYLDLCIDNRTGPRTEKVLYDSRVSVYNAALELLDKKYPKIAASDRIRFYKNDPVRLKYGVYADGVSPDLGYVYRQLLLQGNRLRSTLCGRTLGAAMLVGVEEMKAQTQMPAGFEGVEELRKEVLGIPEETDGTGLPEEDEEEADSEAEEDANIADPEPGSRKRKQLQDHHSATQKVARVGESQRRAVRSPRKLEDVQVQCASYAMEALSLTPLRSHFIMSLVDRTRLQLMYYDASVILVASPVDMSTGEGKAFFLSMVIALHRMNAVDRGFRNIIHDHQEFTHNLGFMAEKLGDSKGTRVWSNLLKNMVLETSFGCYVITEVLFRQAGIIGRLTYVVRAHRKDRPTESVVIKISCPSLSREPEEKLVNAARDAAIKIGGESHWVLNHLPKILHAEDIKTSAGSTQDRVASFLNEEASYVAGGKYHYEYRTLHIVILEELFPINTLPCASDFAQVFFDVLNCHKWLHDVPRILHRDISMSNIMYRYGDDGAVYGVLNDMDLSSLVADLEDQKATSFMRTGTPPFMAVDLLRSHRSELVHLYRHDLESLFYVMLILSTRHQISCDGLHPRARPKNNLVARAAPPFSDWFDSSLTWITPGTSTT
ncbi:hypothetical protein BDZ89DRAFT_1169185 [Hymenopellis radicata]|nr:hypothetical protein BDZ89DRAFT_1169185 [Hymenopellis radicata]